LDLDCGKLPDRRFIVHVLQGRSLSAPAFDPLPLVPDLRIESILKNAAAREHARAFFSSGYGGRRIVSQLSVEYFCFHIDVLELPAAQGRTEYRHLPLRHSE
jgi:hypothetical protein